MSENAASSTKISEEGLELVRVVLRLTGAAQQSPHGIKILRSVLVALSDLADHVEGVETDFGSLKPLTAAPDHRPLHALAVARVMQIVASPDISGARKALDVLQREIGDLP